VSPRQKSPQPQQPDVTYYQAFIGRCRRQPVNGGGAIMCGITPAA
jgi:hypothetical protein